MRSGVRVLVAVALLAGGVGGPVGPAAAQPSVWSIRPSVSPPGPPYGGFSGVACATATTCFAVGQASVQQWNGTSWSAVSVLGPGGVLNGVACPAPTTCVGVGYSTTNGVTTSLSAVWNGTAWSTGAGPA